MVGKPSEPETRHLQTETKTNNETEEEKLMKPKNKWKKTTTTTTKQQTYDSQMQNKKNKKKLQLCHYDALISVFCKSLKASRSGCKLMNAELNYTSPFQLNYLYNFTFTFFNYANVAIGDG